MSDARRHLRVVVDYLRLQGRQIASKHYARLHPSQPTAERSALELVFVSYSLLKPQVEEQAEMAKTFPCLKTQKQDVGRFG